MKLGVECRLCGDQIFSLHRHHFKWCKCKKTFVDGGDDYLRCGGDVFPITIKKNLDGSIERVKDEEDDLE